jgi:uncharacterized lipoprotein YmbA
MSARRLFATAAGVAICAGCGSSPNSTFYALVPTGAEAAAGAPSAPRSIKVRRITIPGYLDRPEIVRKVVDYRLGIAPNERWGEPLDEMLGRVVAQDLESRLPGSSVFSESGSITTDPQATVEVDIRRFDVDDRGEVSLVAEVAVESKGSRAAPASTAVTLHQAPKDSSTTALVATMSELVAALSSRIAAVLRSGASG